MEINESKTEIFVCIKRPLSSNIIIENRMLVDSRQRYIDFLK